MCGYYGHAGRNRIRKAIRCRIDPCDGYPRYRVQDIDEGTPHMACAPNPQGLIERAYPFDEPFIYALRVGHLPLVARGL